MTELVKPVTKEEVSNRLIAEELNEFIIGINEMLLKKGKAFCYFGGSDGRVGDVAEYYRKAGWEIEVRYNPTIDTIKLTIK